MKIECYLSMNCGSEEELYKNILEALKLESIEAETVISRIEDSVARALGLRGSPTVLVDGRDISPAALDGFG